MIEETGQVVAVEDGAVWVETVRVSGCQSCSANKGCGHAVMDRKQAGSRARIRALNSFTVSEGQAVVLGLPEGALLKGAVVVYLLPLLLLFIGALIGEGLAGAGHGAVVGGLLGLALGFVGNRWYSQAHEHDVDLQPQVLRLL
ncbi:MAG: SoxR reducing system RseC family protein [Alcanivoracaceae bacterium]|nr:SoxR reducing system RseC family protein [Alcanivoracaceae bacterium]